MSLLKRHTGRRRHVGRRVAGVAVGVALLVVGLEAPAYAVVPTVTGFTPASGDDGCVVQITGTAFTNPTVTSVTFGGAVAGVAADFQVISDTEIWATAPIGNTSGAIRVTNGSGTGISPTGWIDGDPAGCSPTADSFAPTCGPAGTDVTITGTNLLQGVSPVDGADVFFSPFTGNPASGVGPAAPSAGTTPTFTSVTVDVPGGAADGPLGVKTFANPVGAGSDFSPTQFDFGTCITEVSPTSGAPGTTVTITGVGFQGVTTVTFAGAGGPVQAIFTLTTDTEAVDTITATVPVGAIDGPLTVNTPGGNPTFAFGGDGVVHHPRNVTLKLSGALRMKGKVKVADDTAECFSGVPVKLQRKKKGGGWKTLKTVTTSDTGAYSGKVKNRPGKYRSVAPKVTLADSSICDKDASPVRRN
jgi:hypothetical protein